MSKITKLDDIEIYRDALQLANKIYLLSKISPLSRDFSLCNQMRRAAISVAANIAEGYGRNTKKDFAQFLSIALGSVNEVIAYLDFIALVFKINIQDPKKSYLELSKRIFSFRRYLLSVI